MAELCIVCLGDLRTSLDDNEQASNSVDASEPHPAKTNQSADTDADEIIAHLLPCGHTLHNQCLLPWVQRANSCPTCRQNFNMVELRATLEGPSFSSYAVQDKQQQADLDPGLVIEDDLYDVEEPCLICGRVDESQETMWCDGCDRVCHVFCAGSDEVEVPEVWYCGDCLNALDNHRSVGARRPVRRTRTQRQPPRSRRPRRPDSEWARVWRTVWNRLDLDLDFPFEEETGVAPRSETQRRELAAWEQRLAVANRGGVHRFRDTAAALLDRQRAPESQEELRAWNAFDKARELDDDHKPVNRRKRQSETASPASPKQPDTTEQRKLKRPRTKRNLRLTDQQDQAESSHQALQRNGEGPSFLTSLLQEVERQPAPIDGTSPDANHTDDQFTTALSSPAASPTSSHFGTPRAASVTPPPQAFSRPSSPTPLTSIVRPRTSPMIVPFSPFSPAETSAHDVHQRDQPRGRQHSQQNSPTRGQSPQSPSRHLSYSTKAEIQRMVKTALGSRYRDHEISKDQYTDINRDVSRMLYDEVGDAEGLADHAEREKWQQMAVDAVEKAVDAVRAQS